MKTLVIGYGNTLRGDDGVGPHVAEQLQLLEANTFPESPIKSLAVHQLTPELAVEVSQADVVWFVDAWVGGVTPIVQPLTLTAGSPSLEHGWQPEGLLHLAKALYGAQPIAYHLLIPARQFEHGETFSTIAHCGVDWALQTIQAATAEPDQEPFKGTEAYHA